MCACSDQLIVCTDDGSYGRKALVTEPLKELLETEKDLARAWAIGPAVMMKFVAETTRPFKLPTLVSLNTIMVDGTGMCGGCRVVLDDGAQFVCVDGPEFDAHRVNWSLLLERLSFYRVEELQAVQRWESHTCRLDQVLDAAGVP
jgi:ferredoxin--NADP+ reductase